MDDKMEDKFNTGETRYKDVSGKDLTEQEYLKLLKKQGSSEIKDSRIQGVKGSSKNQEPETTNHKP